MWRTENRRSSKCHITHYYENYYNIKRVNSIHYFFFLLKNRYFIINTMKKISIYSNFLTRIHIPYINSLH